MSRSKGDKRFVVVMGTEGGMDQREHDSLSAIIRDESCTDVDIIALARAEIGDEIDLSNNGICFVLKPRKG